MELRAGSSPESRAIWIADLLTLQRASLDAYFHSCGIRDAADRQDLLQDLYLLCHRKAERICGLPEAERSPYVWRVAFNLAMSWHRRSKQQPSIVEIPETRPIPDSRPDPQQLLLNQEQDEAARAAEPTTEATARKILQILSDGRAKELARTLTKLAVEFRCHSCVEVLHFLRRYLFGELRSKKSPKQARGGSGQDPKRKEISAAIITLTGWSRQSLDNKCWWLRRRWAAAASVVVPGGGLPDRPA